jgi:hypothetical protein
LAVSSPIPSQSIDESPTDDVDEIALPESGARSLAIVSTEHIAPQRSSHSRRIILANGRAPPLEATTM